MFFFKKNKNIIYIQTSVLMFCSTAVSRKSTMSYRMGTALKPVKATS